PQGLVIFELLPRADMPAGQEQYRVSAGEGVAEARHPPGAAGDIARREIPLVARPAQGERRLDRLRLLMIGRVIADEDQHAASPSLFLIVACAAALRP